MFAPKTMKYYKPSHIPFPAQFHPHSLPSKLHSRPSSLLHCTIRVDAPVLCSLCCAHSAHISFFTTTTAAAVGVVLITIFVIKKSIHALQYLLAPWLLQRVHHPVAVCADDCMSFYIHLNKVSSKIIIPNMDSWMLTWYILYLIVTIEGNYKQMRPINQ